MIQEHKHEWQIERGSHAMFGVGRTVWCDCGESMNVEDLLNAWQESEAECAKMKNELNQIATIAENAIGLTPENRVAVGVIATRIHKLQEK